MFDWYVRRTLVGTTIIVTGDNCYGDNCYHKTWTYNGGVRIMIPILRLVIVVSNIVDLKIVGGQILGEIDVMKNVIQPFVKKKKIRWVDIIKRVKRKEDSKVIFQFSAK